MKEVHLFIPTEDFELPVKQGKTPSNRVILTLKVGLLTLQTTPQPENHGLENCTTAITLRKEGRRS